MPPLALLFVLMYELKVVDKVPVVYVLWVVTCLLFVILLHVDVLFRVLVLFKLSLWAEDNVDKGSISDLNKKIR